MEQSRRKAAGLVLEMDEYIYIDHKVVYKGNLKSSSSRC